MGEGTTNVVFVLFLLCYTGTGMLKGHYACISHGMRSHMSCEMTLLSRTVQLSSVILRISL